MTAANHPNFHPEKYANIASNHLVVYAIYSLYKDGDEISAEDIISACFMLFPKKFSLRTYPQWPDSALVGRRLHDCEKNGWLTARIDTGFKLTALGNKLAEKIARELGVEIPKKEKPKQVDKLQVTEEPNVQRSTFNVEKAEEPVTTKPVEKIVAPAAKPALVKSKPAKKAQAPAVKAPKLVEKKVAAPAAKPAPVKPKVEKAREKRVDKLQVTEAVKPAPIKSKPLKKEKIPAVKASKPVEKKTVAPTAKPAPLKPKPEEKAKAPVAKTPKPAEKKVAAPVAKPAPVKPKVEKAKEKRVDKVQVTEAVKPAPIAKPKPEPKAPTVAVQKPLFRIPTVSAEEKAKAGKFVKMMEGSDAYRLYKKNGANANIGEFDFRSLLLCTMESSHETLVRNVDLFKGYAEIHNRQDLVAFLAACRDKFAHLLTPEKKAVKKFK